MSTRHDAKAGPRSLLLCMISMLALHQHGDNMLAAASAGFVIPSNGYCVNKAPALPPGSGATPNPTPQCWPGDDSNYLAPFNYVGGGPQAWETWSWQK